MYVQILINYAYAYAYYSGIMLVAEKRLLFQKLCQHIRHQASFQMPVVKPKARWTRSGKYCSNFLYHNTIGEPLHFISSVTLIIILSGTRYISDIACPSQVGWDGACWSRLEGQWSREGKDLLHLPWWCGLFVQSKLDTGEVKESDCDPSWGCICPPPINF